MRILHYFLGPNRQGGLNRYVRDLAAAQVGLGHQVMLLYPCGGLFPPASPSIQCAGRYRGATCYRLVGGLPVPLLEGIRDPAMMVGSRRRLTAGKCREFVDETRPDVLHVHTWMGFPRELLEVMRARGVRVVFTTHDYFGLCPKVNLIDDAGQPCTDCSNARCSGCNAAAPGERFLSLRNSAALMRLKGVLTPLLRLRQACRRRREEPAGLREVKVLDYASLREYYLGMLRQCDCIHCNSRVAERVYASFLPGGNFRVLPITHGGICWRPLERRDDGSGALCLGFSGSEAAFKGLPMLLEVLAGLESLPWHLEVWGPERRETCGRIRYCGRYRRVEQAFGHLDLLIVPSVWNETFGFVVAEALGLGVPVLCSDTVGAQCLVEDSMVFHGREGLTRRLKELLEHPEVLREVRRRLVEGAVPDWSVEHHASEMMTNVYGR